MHFYVVTIFLLLVFSTFNVFSQDDADTFPMTIIVDEDSLVLYIPEASEETPVSLEGFGISVIIDGQEQRSELTDYASFGVLEFDNLTMPVCLQLQRADADTSLAPGCDEAAPRFVQELAARDVFWHDDETD